MDHARKIGKTNKPIVWSHGPSLASSTCTRATSMDDEETREDRRLVNWRKWLKDREKHYRHYEKLCARERDDLLMIKDLDDFHRKDEEPMVRKSIFGKHRVPEFWVTPEMLSKHGHPDWPDIPVTLTANRTSQSTTERVGLSELIKREKGLTISREQSAAKEAAEKNIPRKIQRLRAADLDIEKLAIKGEKWAGKARKRVAKKCGASSFESLRTIKSDDGSQSDVIEREQDRSVVLVIQDREVTPNRRISLDENDDLTSNELFWSLIFKSTGHRVEREIRLENRGDFAIVYRWRCKNEPDTNCLPHSPQNSPFFFNKNKGLVLPGQKVKLLVWFRSLVPHRVATELWTLKTEPPVCQESLIFRFWGIATLSTDSKSSLHQTGSANSSRCERIEKYLDRRIRDVKIHEIIESIVENVDRKVFSNPIVVPYVGFFLEREIFVAKNPTYFWHSELIRELRQIYDQATSHDSPEWSLSLVDLRTTLLKIKDPQDRTESLLRFNQLARQLLRSSCLEPTGSIHKESMVYNLLCSFANKFEEESDYIASKCSLIVAISNERISVEAPGDISRSRISISSLSLSTPRKKSRKKSLSGQSKSTSKISMSTNNLDMAGNGWDEKIGKSCLLYKEVLHVTIREILLNTIMAICAVVDSNRNFNHPNK